MQNRNQSGLTRDQIASTVREEDLQELEDWQRDLEGRVHSARENGRIFMMQEYTTMLANISAKVHKIRARFNRENLAELRRAHKELKVTASPRRDEA